MLVTSELLPLVFGGSSLRPMPTSLGEALWELAQECGYQQEKFHLGFLSEWISLPHICSTKIKEYRVPRGKWMSQG